MREREYVVYALESGGGCFFRVCLENICKREYVWMFGVILQKGFVWRNIEERVCLEKYFRKGMFGENISNGMFEENI